MPDIAGSVARATAGLNRVQETELDPEAAHQFQKDQLNMVEDLTALNIHTINMHKVTQQFIDGARG